MGTATVTAPPPSTFRVPASTAAACTSGSISGDVGTFRPAPAGSFAGVNCPVSNGTVQIGTGASIAACSNFAAAYDARAKTYRAAPC
ncbi:MAG TPA: hypothetical protein VF006_08320 [Longimicrobium sp.]